MIKNIKTALCLIFCSLLATGCQRTDAGQPVEAEIPSWEEYKAQVSRTAPDGETYYLIEWDIAIHSERELRAHYEVIYGLPTDKSIVNQIDGEDNLWTLDEALDLTYCVSDAFGADKARAVSEMAAATEDWEDVANVQYIYVSSEDDDCSPSNPAIDVPVQPWVGGGACAFFPPPVGSGCVTETLVMNFGYFDGSSEWPNATTTGVFRHELGHTLGLRHEHTRPESGICFEDSSWRELTAYDVNSVMHYPQCNGVATSDLSITALDAEGLRSLYGMPASWYMPFI